MERLRLGGSVEVRGTAGIPFERCGKLNLRLGDLEVADDFNSKGVFGEDEWLLPVNREREVRNHCVALGH